MGIRDWSIEGQLPQRRRNKHLNDVLRSKRSERHEPKHGEQQSRARQKQDVRRMSRELDLDGWDD